MKVFCLKQSTPPDESSDPATGPPNDQFVHDHDLFATRLPLPRFRSAFHEPLHGAYGVAHAPITSIVESGRPCAKLPSAKPQAFVFIPCSVLQLLRLFDIPVSRVLFSGGPDVWCVDQLYVVNYFPFGYVSALSYLFHFVRSDHLFLSRACPTTALNWPH